MKKAKTQPDTKLSLGKNHLIILTADQSNGITGGGSTGRTAKAGSSDYASPCIPENTVSPTGLADTCMPVIP